MGPATEWDTAGSSNLCPLAISLFNPLAVPAEGHHGQRVTTVCALSRNAMTRFAA